MPDDDAGAVDLQSRALLLDPGSLRVVWDSAWPVSDADGATGAGAPGDSLEESIPLATRLGLPETAEEVARTGVPRQVSADVVTTSRGTLRFVATVFRLPDAQLLILTENAWQVRTAPPSDGLSRRRRTTARRGAQ